MRGVESSNVTDPRGLVVVGASAGGVEALRTFAGGLPPGFTGAVCVVLHIPRTGTSALPQILSRSGPLPAVHARDGMPLAAGRIHVAPANAHLMVQDGKVRLSHGPTENGHRPAVDPLFRSAARWWGASVAGVVLSGNRDDGAFGLAEIVRSGGVGVVQDPAEALYPSMPRQAAAHAAARTMPVARVGAFLAELVEVLPGPAPRAAAAGDEPKTDRPKTLDAKDPVVAMEEMAAGGGGSGGVPAGFGCPTCDGALFELPGGGPRFRCRVGHAWTASGLLEELGGSLEGALWMALRSLEEKAALSRRMADSAAGRGDTRSAAQYGESGTDAAEAGRMILRLIERLGPLEDVAAMDEAS